MKPCYIKRGKSKKVMNRWSAIRCRSTVLFPPVCNSWWHLHSEDQIYSKLCLNVHYPPHIQHSSFKLFKQRSVKDVCGNNRCLFWEVHKTLESHITGKWTVKATRLVLSVLNLEVQAVTTVFEMDNDNFSYHTVGNKKIPTCFRIYPRDQNQTFVTEFN
jgi:hypothetical protein